MLIHRAGGILLHPTSLPGPYGVGDLGPKAHEFVDWLAEAGCRLWQILPLGPTGYGNSPYQCLSAFAGNPSLISLDFLLRDGLLAESDLSVNPRHAVDAAPESGVDYGRTVNWKQGVLRRGFQHFQEEEPRELREELALFRAENAEWLDDYALFMALKEFQGGVSWLDWPASIRRREEPALAEARERLADSSERHVFLQFLFFRQWSELHEHARRNRIQIIGDVPIFAAQDSADVWTHPDYFELDEEGRPTVVAGVPPDYFSSTGQRWGNPLYRWENHKRTGFAWWLGKLRAALKAADVVRLDHFRGLAAHWEIPAGNPTAEIGRWVAAPGEDLLDTVMASLPEIPAVDGGPRLIAEDLGVITADVIALRERYHLPGTKVLQFGFSGTDNPHLPHNFPVNCVAYTGTHDNDTARGWLETAPRRDARFALRYLQTTPRKFPWDLTRSIWSSVAAYAIAPMQDVLGLGSAARMNYPGRPEGNWEWRLRDEDLSEPLARKLRELGDLFGR